MIVRENVCLSTAIILFSITATKGKQVAVPPKVRTHSKVSPLILATIAINGACQPTAIKYSFAFTCILLKRFAVQRKELNNDQTADKTLNREIQILFSVLSLRSLFRTLSILPSFNLHIERKQILTKKSSALQSKYKVLPRQVVRVII